MSRARSGQRIQEAREQIKAWEKAKTDWDHQQLADALGISGQQARVLVATLTARGDLEFADVIVRVRRLVLTDAGKSPAPRAHAA